MCGGDHCYFENSAVNSQRAERIFVFFLSEKKHEYEEFDNRILNEEHLFETKRRKVYEESQKLRLNWRKSEFRPLLKNLNTLQFRTKFATLLR